MEKQNERKPPKSPLDFVNKHAVTELKSLSAPPQMVKEVLHAVLILMDDPYVKKNLNDHYIWSACKKMVGDVNFLSRLRNYQKENMTKSMFLRLDAKVKANQFSVQEASQITAAIPGLWMWVLTVHAYGKTQYSL